MIRSLAAACLLVLFLLCAGPARAEVVVTFWSHDRDQNYPHAFIVMQGRVDSTGEVVDGNIGFTARRVTPMILVRSVDGMMETVSGTYMGRTTSRPHFTLRLDDAEYARLAEFIARWQAHPQPSYNLNRRNCVHFVMEAAAVLGLSVNRQSAYFKKPREFLDEVTRRNPGLTPGVR